MVDGTGVGPANPTGEICGFTQNILEQKWIKISTCADRITIYGLFERS